MKTKVVITVILLSTTIAYTQTNFWGDAASYGQPAQQTYTYIPLPFDYLRQAGAVMQARNEQNKKYIDYLFNWVYELKTKTNDKQFLYAMDGYKQRLIFLNSQDLTNSGDQLRKIEMEIKEEIDSYNTRMKELPIKLWKSASENLIHTKYAEAIDDFTELISVDSDNSHVYLYRGYAYMNQGNYTSAIRDLNKSIEMKDNNPIAYSTRGWIKYYQKDYMGALADFNQQIELDPSATAYCNRGSAKAKLNDSYGAMEDYNKAILLEPSYSMAYNNRGWEKYKLKKYFEALKDLDKALELDPTNAVAYDSRQETKFALNDLKGCIEDCDEAIDINPNLSNSYFYRGRAYYKLGNKSKACEDWSKAGELGKSEAYDFIKKYCNN